MQENADQNNFEYGLFSRSELFYFAEKGYHICFSSFK